MRRLILIFTALMLGAAAVAPAAAADKPATKAPAKKAKKTAPAPPGPFDGFYAGVLIPAPALSKQPCAAVTVAEFEIDRGKVVVLPGVVSFEGTVTATGFLSGAMRRFDDPKVPIQGRLNKEADGVHVRGGVIDEKGGCAWTLDLKARSMAADAAQPADPKKPAPKKK
jgi:hypothetical protein